jgi:3-deoxy-D-manno-octulosonic-acid transferase
VHVTGNSKFDAVVRQDCSPRGKRSEAILRSIIDGGRPCVVAGCVTDDAGQALVLDAFRHGERENSECAAGARADGTQKTWK